MTKSDPPGLPDFALDRVQVDLQAQRLADRLFGETRRTVLGRFEILGELGRGAMGIVYAATDPSLGRKVAIKTIPNQGSPEQQARLEAEAVAMARLAHPNVAVIHEIGKSEDSTFIVMEYVEGRTLRQWLEAEPRSREAILEVFLAAGTGLSAAHDQGLVHRDFKPGNVMVGTDGRVRVMDFGLARADLSLEQTVEHGPGERLEISGTPAYMAPEQFQGRWVDAASDQFAFCVTLHEAFAGERPFAGDTREQTWAAAARGERRPLAPELEDLDVVIARGLRPDPRDRFASMVALLTELRAIEARRRSATQELRLAPERTRHRHGLLGRARELAKLDRWFTTQPCGWFLISGSPGVGKSALAFHWLRTHETDIVVAAHFLHRGQDTDPMLVGQSLAEQIERRHPALADPSVHPSRRLPALLERAGAAGRRVLLLIDGLDEAARTREDPLPTMLPAELGWGVFVLVSSRPGKHLDWLRRRAPKPWALDLDADADANVEAVTTFWADHRHQLEPPLDDALVAAAIAGAQGNLSHAIGLFEHWQAGGAREPTAIPAGLEALVEGIWHDLEAIEDDGDWQLVSEGLALLAAARDELPPTVIETALGWNARRSARFLALVRSFLSQQDAGLRLFHDDLRTAIRERLPRESQAAHGRLAGLATWDDEHADELSWRYALTHTTHHLVEAGRWREAAALCLDVGYLRCKARELGVQALEHELDGIVAGRPRRVDDPGVAELARVLRSCAHWARRDPQALPSLLHDRLLTRAPQLLARMTWPADDGAPTLTLRRPLQHGIGARVLEGHQGRVNAVAALPGGRCISGGDDRRVLVTEIDSGQILATLEGHAHAVTAVAALSGRRVVSGSRDATLRIWDIHAATPQAILRGHRDEVTAVVVMADGRIISASGDGTLRVWSGEGIPLTVLEGHDGAVRCLAVLDERRVVSGGEDRSVRLWNLDDGRTSATFHGHEGPVTAVAVLADGRVASAATDRQILLWSDDGSPPGSLRGHRRSVGALVVIDDEHLL
ncbi:MAG: protein kinase [Myxococcales bacterium]|nr:protein kinase [Myxococcales bacterium]